MNAETDKAARTRRKSQPRRVVSLTEQRESKPFFLGWGAELNHRERESLKERIALMGGIALAAVLVILLGWGWYQDNIAGPAAVRAANNQEVAQVGKDIIRMGFYKRFQKFEYNQLTSEQQQITAQLQQLQADTKHAKQNAATIAQLEQQDSLVQQQLGDMASGTLTQLIDDDVLLQRSFTAGVPITAKVESAALTQAEHNLGGRMHYYNFVQQSGLTQDEFKQLVLADYVRPKVEANLQKQVSHTALEVRASHILIPAKQKALAEKLYKEVLHGANFAALAKKYSKDPGSAAKGGDLGFFTKGSMVPAFDKAAFSMKVGQIRLVQSTYGWHIIKLTGRKVMRLTPSQYQQAQQGAYSSWLAAQQAKLTLRHFVAPQNLPVVATPSAASSVPTAAPVVQATAPASSKPPTTHASTGSNGTGSQPATHTSNKTSSTGKSTKP